MVCCSKALGGDPLNPLGGVTPPTPPMPIYVDTVWGWEFIGQGQSLVGGRREAKLIKN